MSNTDIKSSEGIPNCKKVIPIHPVRYAIMPSEKGEYLYSDNKNLKQDFAKLDKASYTLRSLRKNAYVYIYDPDARNKWLCFYVGESGFYRRNIDLSTGKLSRADEKPFSYIYADAHEHQPEKVYIGYTDSPYTKKLLDGVEGGKLKATIMQEIDLYTWTVAAEVNWESTKESLSKAPSVKHTFLSSELEDLNLDYSDKYNTNWSEEQGLSLNIGNIKSGQLGANKKLQLSVALYDAVGIASELSHLVGLEVAKLNQFVEQNARKAWVSSTIDELTKRAGQRAVNNEKGSAADYALTHNSYGAAGGAMNDAHARINEAKERARYGKIADYHSYNREAERQAFKLSYPKELKQIQEAIEIAGQDHKEWMCNYLEGSLFYSLMSYDANDSQSYIGLRASFARCIDALPASKAGVDFAKTDLITPAGPIGIFALPLLGHPLIKDYVDIKGNAGKLVDEFSNTKLKALTELLKEIPPDNASKTISRTLSALMPATVGFSSWKEYQRTVYPSTMEAMEGVLIASKSMSLEDFTEQVLQKKSTGHTQNYFRFTTSKQILQTKVTIIYPEEVNIPLTEEQNQRKTDILQRTKFWTSMKAGVSAVGLFFGGFSTFEALGKLRKDDRNILVNSIGLGNSALTTSSGTAGLIQVGFDRASLSTTKNQALYKGVAENAERVALSLLAAAAIMAGVKDVVLASQTSGRRRIAYGSAFVAQMGVAGIATYQLTTKLAEAGNIRAIKAVGVVNEMRVVKGIVQIAGKLNIGVFLGTLMIEAIAFGLEKYAEAHDDDEVLAWIEHSIWGKEGIKSWDQSKEQYELNRLYISPKIIKQDWVRWEDFQVILPGYKSQISDYEVKKGSTDIKAKGILNDKHGIAVVTFKDIESWGDITVDYKPDAYNKPEIIYTSHN